MVTLLAASALQAATGATKAIGSLFFAYLDSKLIASLTSKGNDAREGLKLNDLGINQTAEGFPVNRVFGRTVRVSGGVVWMPRTREIQKKKSGGKSGSNSDFVVYKRFGHVAIELARTYGQPIDGVNKLWLNGTLFYNSRPNISLTSSVATFAAGGIAATLEIQRGLVSAEPILLLESQVGAGGPDLSQFVPGRAISVAGFTDGTHPIQLDVTISGNQSTQSNFNHDGYVEGPLTLKSSVRGFLESGDSFTIQNDSTGTVYHVVERVQFTATGASGAQVVQIVPPIQEAVVDGEAIQNLKHNAAQNNGAASVFRVVGAGYDDRSDTSYVRLRRKDGIFIGDVDAAFSFGSKREGTLDAITLAQELPTHNESQASAVRFHLGSDDQAADPLIIDYEEERLGANNAQAYTRRVVAVIEDLDLTQYGILPQVEAELQVSDDDDVATSTLVPFFENDLGLSAGEYDVTGVTGSLEGYTVRGAQRASGTVAIPASVAQLLVLDREGVLVVRNRANLETFTVAAGDLAAHSPGDEELVPFDHKLPDARSTVDQVWVRFLDPANDHRRGAAPGRIPDVVRNSETLDVTAGASITRDQATQLAESLLDLAQVSRDRVRFTLPPSYIDRAFAGSVAQLGTHFGRDWNVMIDNVEIGANYLVVCEGEEYDAEVFTQTKTGAVSGSS